MPPTLSEYRLKVQFDVDKIHDGEPITIEGPFDPSDSKQLRVSQGISLIVLELITLNQGDGPEAQFPTYPIEWFVNQEGSPYNTPVAQPGGFEVHWHNPRQCTIVDTNTALFQNSHPFNVVVAYKNKTYGSDPTIVNEPEDG